jgi:NitT/TauT family transport system substrate-binding protein
MKKLIKVLAVTIVITLVASFATANISAVSFNKKLVKVRFANLKYSISSIPHEIGIQKGIFKKYGIDLQVLNFDQGGPAAAAAAASGQVDMGSFGTPILTSVAKGIPIKIVAAPPIKENDFIMVSKTEIKTIADLKGKTILTGALGGGQHQAAVKILQSGGLTDKDVKIQASGGADALMVMQTGKVDAAITSEPTVTQIIKAKVGHVLARAQDYYGVYEHSYVFATDDFIKKHPDAIKGFLKGSRESYEYVKSHQKESIAYTLKKVNITEDIAKSYFSGQIPKWDLSFQINIKGTANAVKILQDMGEIDKTVVFDENKWLNLNFLK